MSIDDCRLVALPRFDDCRGSLGFIEGNVHIAFAIERVYYLYNIQENAERGAHGHKNLQQLIVALSGSFDVVLDDGKRQKTIRLSRPDEGLYVCPMIWRDLKNFSTASVCMVLASARYDEADYFRDYRVFQEAASIK